MSAPQRISSIIHEYQTLVGHRVPVNTGGSCAVTLNDRVTSVSRIALYDHRYLASGSSLPREVFWGVVFREFPKVVVKLNASTLDTIAQIKSNNPDFTVRLKKIKQVSPDIIKQSFLVTDSKDGYTFDVTAINYLAWPDFGIPEKSSLGRLMETVDGCMGNSGRPLYVQCGAGIGRTGTFIALHCRLQEERLGNHPPFYHIVMEERRQRQMPMIETPEQYLLARTFKPL